MIASCMIQGVRVLTIAIIVATSTQAETRAASLLSLEAEVESSHSSSHKHWDISKDRIHQAQAPKEFLKMMGCWMQLAKNDQNVEKNFWITAGTLLGQERDKKFLAWDHDMDFAFSNDHYRDFWNTMTVGLKNEKDSNKDSVCNGFSFRQHYYKAAAAWGFKASLNGYDGTWIADFFPVMSSVDQETGKASMTQFAGTIKRTKAIYTVPADSVYPTKECVISGVPARCPRTPSDILDKRYGLNKWKSSPYDHFDKVHSVWVKAAALPTNKTSSTRLQKTSLVSHHHKHHRRHRHHHGTAATKSPANVNTL